MTPQEIRLSELVRMLSNKLTDYNGITGKPEIKWEMLDIATELNQDVVRLCENQCDYQFVLSSALSDLNKAVGNYLGDMESGSFGKYCRSRKRNLKNPAGHSKLEYEVLGLMFDIPRSREEYEVLKNVIGEHSPKNNLK
jgi:hypothetical protein